jgi:hypothetical protein
MTRQDLIDFRTEITAKISDICRFIGLGLVAVFYTIKSSEEVAKYENLESYSLYLVGLAGVLAILLDYIQYVNNYIVVEKSINANVETYDQKSWAYKIAEFCFWWKQRVTLAGAVALIVLVAST